MELNIVSINVNNQVRIGVKPQFNTDYFGATIRKIEGRKWCGEQRLWHIPYNQISYAALKRLFEDCSIVTQNTSCQIDESVPNISVHNAIQNVENLSIKQHTHEAQNLEQLSLNEHPFLKHYLCLKLPKSLKDSYLDIVKNIHGRRWNYDLFAWEIPYTLTTIRFIESYLGDDIT